MSEYQSDIAVATETPETSKGKTAIKDEDLSMFPFPRSGCSHCYGRGYEGWNVVTEEVVLCRCIKNRAMKVFEQDKLMTYGQLRELYNGPREARGLGRKEADAEYNDIK